MCLVGGSSREETEGWGTFANAGMQRRKMGQRKDQVIGKRYFW